MAELEPAKYSSVIAEGRKAVAALKAKNIDDFLQHAETGWDLFPSPAHSWNQSYNYAKMVYKGAMENRRFKEAKTWLDKMIDNNNLLKLSEGECQHYEGKYYFETGDYKRAYNKFKYVVDKDGCRYFEDEDPKYLDFYRSPDKYMNV